jgi:hypothetical protein
MATRLSPSALRYWIARLIRGPTLERMTPGPEYVSAHDPENPDPPDDQIGYRTTAPAGAGRKLTAEELEELERTGRGPLD